MDLDKLDKEADTTAQLTWTEYKEKSRKVLIYICQHSNLGGFVPIYDDRSVVIGVCENHPTLGWQFNRYGEARQLFGGDWEINTNKFDLEALIKEAIQQAK